MLNSDYDYKKGQAALDAGRADAISFGRPFISNRDLPKRFAKRCGAHAGRQETWYEGGEAGYLTYTLAET